MITLINKEGWQKSFETDDEMYNYIITNTKCRSIWYDDMFQYECLKTMEGKEFADLLCTIKRTIKK
jgi:hypothetical protein